RCSVIAAISSRSLRSVWARRVFSSEISLRNAAMVWSRSAMAPSRWVSVSSSRFFSAWYSWNSASCFDVSSAARLSPSALSRARLFGVRAIDRRALLDELLDFLRFRRRDGVALLDRGLLFREGGFALGLAGLLLFLVLRFHLGGFGGVLLLFAGEGRFALFSHVGNLLFVGFERGGERLLVRGAFLGVPLFERGERLRLLFSGAVRRLQRRLLARSE